MNSPHSNIRRDRQIQRWKELMAKVNELECVIPDDYLGLCRQAEASGSVDAVVRIHGVHTQLMKTSGETLQLLIDPDNYHWHASGKANTIYMGAIHFLLQGMRWQSKSFEATLGGPKLFKPRVPTDAEPGQELLESLTDIIQEISWFSGNVMTRFLGTMSRLNTRVEKKESSPSIPPELRTLMKKLFRAHPGADSGAADSGPGSSSPSSDSDSD